jgi:RNA polymerase sigma factor for flagellar operon FliA
MTDALWKAHAAGDPGAREQLLEAHLGLVRHVARQLARTLAARAELDELVSAGTIGLMAAVDAFDPGRGVAFSSFAAPRIRGAILDELRRQDHLPRSLRRKARALAQARERASRATGRPASAAEIAGLVGVDHDTLLRWQADAEGARHVSLDGASGDPKAGGRALADVLADGGREAVDERVEREEEVAVLQTAILALPERERVLLSLYYFEELKLHEIAEILGLTESRVSQLRARALSSLRRTLRPERAQVA